MFRNATVQRSIALILLATLGGTGSVPAWARVPLMVGGVPLQPLQPRTAPAAALLPLNVAPGPGKTAGHPAPTAKDGAGGYGRAVAELAAGSPSSGVKELRASYAALQRLEDGVDSDFAGTEARLAAARLPAEIMERQREARAAFSAARAELKASMAALDTPAARSEPNAALGKVRATLQRLAPPAATPAMVWPWSARSAAPRPVALTGRAHERLFPRSVLLASAGTLSGMPLPDAILGEAATEADLAITADADRGAAIAELGASLENNPVRIYNWVRNNIRYTVGYGAMQGASGVLQSGRGNDIDSASLLVALYRQAGIPARYVYGTVEIPAARMLAWLGVDSSGAAQAMLTQAGVPHQVVDAGGVASAFQIEHVWVKARIDLQPSRGARQHAATTWVELDPSFKQTTSGPDLDLRTALALNASGVLDGARKGAACTIDRAQYLNVAQLGADYNAYASRADAYLAQQGADLSVADALGVTTVKAENHGILLGTLPYRTVVQGAEVNVLPDALRWQFRIRLFDNAADRAGGQPVVQLAGPLANYAQARVTLSFAPASEADAAVFAAYQPAPHADGSPAAADQFAQEIPGYLVRMKAQLRVDGIVVSSGGSFVLGSALAADAGLFDPTARDWLDTDLQARAGEYHAFAFDAQGVSSTMLAAAAKQLDAARSALTGSFPGAVGRDDLQGALLRHAALAWFATIDANGALFQKAAGAYEQRLPSYGRAVAAVTADMLYGVVGTVRFPGVALNVDRLGAAVGARTGGTPVRVYVRAANRRNAAYAAVVLDRLFGRSTRPVAAGSAIGALAGAARAGTPVYAVTAANAATVVPRLGLDSALAASIADAAGAGNRLLVPDADTTFGTWVGRALLAEDPVSGAGTYRLVEPGAARTAVAYPAGGMPWLALASAAVSGAVLADDLAAAQRVSATLSGLLATQGNGSSVRWSYFDGRHDLVQGLFLANLATAPGADPCTLLTGVVAAGLGLDAGLSGLDHAQVAPPLVSSAPPSSAAATQPYRYAVAATDPQGLPLTYRLLAAAPGMDVDTAGVVSWTVPQAGSYPVIVRVDNGAAYTDQAYTLEVGTAPVPLTVSVGVNPAIANAGANVTITVAGSGGSGPVTRSLTVDGQTVALDAGGRAVIVAAASGAHPIVATARDAAGVQTQATLYSVRDGADTTAPTAIITAPTDDADVTAPATVTGTATDAHFAYYKLLLRTAGEGAWREIGGGTRPVTAGALGRLDPTQLSNGIYELMLVVTDVNGQQTSQVVTVDVNGQLKIGQFALSFLDLDVEASGIPIRVTRSYDTRRRQDGLDFGYGWSVDYQSVQVRKNLSLGLDWNIVTHPQEFTICLVSGTRHKLNITLPTGEVARFEAANAQQCAVGQVPPVDIQFTALPGTSSRLEMINIPLIQVQGNVLFDMDNLEPWDPREFKLTTAGNYEYILRDGVGIVQIRDPSGNTLDFGQNGIVHSNGQSVYFTRDALGRITDVTDPSGKHIAYGYSATGDLSRVTDRLGGVSTFAYDREHGLTAYTDPSGTLAVRYTYDADGRVIAVTDAQGNAVQMTHDLASNTEVVKDRRGNATTYTYDNAGNVLEKIDAAGKRTTYGYDALGNETSVTDANGKTLARTFNPKSGKQLTERDPMGNTVSWEYDGSTGTVVQKTTDAMGNITTYGYGERGQSINQPLGLTISFGNNSAGDLERLTVAGRTTSYVNDAKGNRLSQTDAAGNTTTYQYDASNREIGRSTTRVAPDGGKVVETLTSKRDAAGRVVERADAMGNVARTEYNPGGQMTASFDAAGRRTAYEYDSSGRPVKTMYANGSAESTTYDANGNAIAMTDRQGRVTRSEYDVMNRLTRTSYPDGTSTATEYDAVGRVIAEIDALGRRQARTYDDAGRTLSTTDATGRANQYTYDANGNRTSVTTADGKATQFAFDALSRLVKTTSPSGIERTFAWNLDGTQPVLVDPLGTRFEFGYDAVAQMGKVQQTDGINLLVTQYSFDSAGNNVMRQDAEGRITRWDYDALGRVVARKLPGGQVERFNYDKAGDIVERVAFDGRSVIVSYDAVGQPTLVVRPDGARIGRTYTRSGQLGSVTVTAAPDSGVEAGTTTFTYDAQDRLVRRLNPDDSFLGYGYDAGGNIVERSSAAGTVRYGYDAAGRMQSVVDMDGGTTRYDYDKAGRVAAVHVPNGVLTSYGHDDDGNLVQVAHANAAGKLLAAVRYTMSTRGQKTRAEEFDDTGVLAAGVLSAPVRSTAFGYDQAGRLVTETLAGRDGVATATVTYEYDRAGNRLRKTEQTANGATIETYRYDQNDRLTQVEASAGAGTKVITLYTWDASGNLLTRTRGGEQLAYSWNSDNRLVGVEQRIDGGVAQVLASYTYDFAGNRIVKKVPAGAGAASVYRYLVDEMFPYAQTVQETISAPGGASTENVYVWGLQEIGQRSAGVATYAHMDGTGSVRLLTDTAGTPVARRDFDVYGMPRASSGAATSVYQYAGEYRDETIGMQYHRARWYQPELGRFATMDVVDGVRKQPVTQNKYVYAGDNPVANSDPSGAFLVSQAYAMEIMASVYTIPTASYIGLTAGLAGRVALYAAASALGTYVVVDQASKQNMEECMQSSFSGQNKCKPDFAMFILGDDYDEVREHVGSALSDGQPSFLSRRAPPHKRDWMKTGTVGRCLKSSLTNCDEYPWAAAIEGGEHNNVSLRSVNGSQNKGAGSTLRWFHEKCKIPANTPAVKYKVLAVKGIARTGYVCQR